jgi:WD40 repeat protein
MNKFLLILSAIISITDLCYSQHKYISLSTEDKIIYGICFSPNGKVIAVADKNDIKFFSTDKGVLIHELINGHSKRILCIDISEDSSLMACGGMDSLIIIWDLIKQKKITELSYQHGIITDIKFSADGKFLFSGGTDHKLFMYDIQKDAVKAEFADHKDDITSLALSNDGQTLISSSGNGMLRLNAIYHQSQNNSVWTKGRWIRAIAASADSNLLVSCDDKARVTTWDISDLVHIGKLECSRIGYSRILSIDIFRDGKTYVIGNLLGHVKIINKKYRYGIKIHKTINKVMFNPGETDKFKLAIATSGKGVLLLDASNMRFTND